MRGNGARRLGLLATLYFAQGLPFGFFVQALPALLRQQGYSLSEIGLASLLTLPWALKFLWAPVVDRRWSARLGRRRTWILAMQLAGVITLVSLATAPAAMPSSEHLPSAASPSLRTPTSSRARPRST